ncbi:MAG TPA: ABC transporter permease [Myxococcota bacterium]|nr:ABC transporter permease [Myxococcota bacterium]
MSDSSDGAVARVWRELLLRRRAGFGLCVIAALGLLALTADFLASDKPYYLKLDGESYYPIAIDYGVWLGVRQWPAPLVNQRFAALAERAEAVYWPPIPYSPTAPDITGDVFEPPSRAHWFGTDGLGRDVAAGMLHGIRISLTVGLVVVAIQATIGIALGGLAGYYGGAADLVLSRLFEIMLGVPTFFLILTVAATFPPSIYLIMAILGLTGWVGIARLIRGEFLKVRAMDYVAAAQTLGASDARIMWRHVLPNAIAPVLVSMSFGVASAILTESGLSFLGIGVPAQLVTWGSILSVAQSNTTAWWLAVFPGAAIFVTVTAYNLLGDALRDALDPREQGT